MRAKFDPNAKIAVKLLRSLYGHPLAGKLWQEHLAQKLRSVGGEEVPGHPSNWLFWFKKELLVLNIYVDDLSLAGKVELHQEFWERLRKHIKIEPEAKIEDGARVLGRNHTIHRSPSETTVTLDMRAYAEQVIELYLELSGLERKKLRKVPTPCLSEASIADDDLAEEGELGSVAARILMKLLWLARLSRPDLYFITGRLATKVTRWTRWEDKVLFRAISYLNGTVDLCLTASVSHDEEPSLHVYTDADFGSCPFTTKSTSGIRICVETGSSRFPVFWSSRKQSSVARSTPEAEAIAMSTAMFSEAINIQSFLQHFLGYCCKTTYHQDNETLLTILAADIVLSQGIVAECTALTLHQCPSRLMMTLSLPRTAPQRSR